MKKKKAKHEASIAKSQLCMQEERKQRRFPSEEEIAAIPILRALRLYSEIPDNPFARLEFFRLKVALTLLKAQFDVRCSNNTCMTRDEVRRCMEVIYSSG
jgi:hypothetical protein